MLLPWKWRYNKGFRKYMQKKQMICINLIFKLYFVLYFLDMCELCVLVCVYVCVCTRVCTLLADIALWSKMAQSQGSVITSSPFIKSPCAASVLLKSPSIPHDTFNPTTTYSHTQTLQTRVYVCGSAVCKCMYMYVHMYVYCLAYTDIDIYRIAHKSTHKPKYI